MNTHSPAPAHHPRREARVLAMQALCCLDAQDYEAVAAVETLITESELPLDTRVRARSLLDAARARRSELDALLRQTVSAWDVNRLSPVDRNVIRVAEAELSLQDVPPRVVLDEAIEIAREYGSAESPAFVNGVLDALLKRGS